MNREVTDNVDDNLIDCIGVVSCFFSGAEGAMYEQGIHAQGLKRCSHLDFSDNFDFSDRE